MSHALSDSRQLTRYSTRNQFSADWRTNHRDGRAAPSIALSASWFLFVGHFFCRRPFLRYMSPLIEIWRSFDVGQTLLLMFCERALGDFCFPLSCVPHSMRCGYWWHSRPSIIIIGDKTYQAAWFTRTSPPAQLKKLVRTTKANI